MNQHPQWFQNQIAAGFQQLVCLGLERSPAMDMIEGTVMAWCYSLWPTRLWDEELDTPRMRQTFQRLMAQSTHWPAPKQFTEMLPERIRTRPEINSVASDATRTLHMSKISELLGGLTSLDSQRGGQS